MSLEAMERPPVQGLLANEQLAPISASLSVAYCPLGLWAYRSLIPPGHFRTTLNQDIYYNFHNNLYISFSFYDNYDNQRRRRSRE